MWKDLVNSNKQLPYEREIPIKKEKPSSIKRKIKKNKKNIPSIDEDVSLPLINNANKINTNNNDYQCVIYYYIFMNKIK